MLLTEYNKQETMEAIAEESREEGRREERERNINRTILVHRTEYHRSDEEIKTILMLTFDLSDEEAGRYIYRLSAEYQYWFEKGYDEARKATRNLYLTLKMAGKMDELVAAISDPVLYEEVLKRYHYI